MSSNGNMYASFTNFELPVLDFNFASITDGTGIPPPKRSSESTLPTPPETPSSRHRDLKSTSMAGPGSDDTLSSINGNRKRRLPDPAAETPQSSAEFARPGSMIRLFNWSSMNNNGTDNTFLSGGSDGASNASRPPSQSGASIGEERKPKRSSNWFRRFRSSESQSKRRSNFFGAEEAVIPQQKPTQAPPPVIPELADLKNGQGSLGEDLFNHIK